MRILKLSTASPKNVYSNEELMKTFPSQLPEGVKQNILNLGVSKRHLIHYENSRSEPETILSETELVDVCLEVCGKVVEKASLSIKDIGYFIATYDVNPFLCPGLSQLLVRRFGFSPYIKHVNIQGMACGAFSKSLELAENYLVAHPEDFVLLCVSGINSFWFQNQVQGMKDVMEIKQIGSIKNKKRRQMELRKWIAALEFFLFGDGAAAVIVAKNGEGLAISKIAEVTNLKKKDYSAGFVRLTALNEPFKFGLFAQLGKEIPNLGVEYTAAVIKKLLGKNAENTIKTAKKWAVHTGSEKILDIITEHYGINREKLAESYDILREYGNLAGASLPFILERITSKNVFSEGDTVLTLGYGWGFSASGTMLEYKK